MRSPMAILIFVQCICCNIMLCSMSGIYAVLLLITTLVTRGSRKSFKMKQVYCTEFMICLQYLISLAVSILARHLCCGLISSDSYASWWKIYKVDPNYDAYRSQKSSNKSCFGHKYVCVYEVRCRIVALKSIFWPILPRPHLEMKRYGIDRIG